MGEPKIIGFTGEAGAAANIDLSIPLPGAHSGRRLVEVADIPADAWSDAARTSGTGWAEELGFTLNPQIGAVLTDPNSYIDRYFSGLRKASSAHSLLGNQTELRKQDVDLMLDAQQAALQRSAEAHQREHDTLSTWSGGIDAETLPIPAPGPTFPTTNLFQAQRHTVAAPTPQQTNALRTKQVAAASAVNAAFQTALSQATQGTVQLPTTKWGGGLTMTTVDLNESSEPRLFIVQVFGISSFLGDYGLGRTVKTFTLLPGEETTISTRTWRATEESRSASSTIVDSYDESSSERFADTVLSETTDAYTESQTNNWNVEGEASASWGWGSASVSGGASGESTSGTEEFAKSVDESVAEHAHEASSHRENTVTSSSESSEESGMETVIERTISNINVKRTLNFVFRELNQSYLTKTHLKDVRIAFSNGRSGSWRETPLSGLATFMDDLFADEGVKDDVIQWVLAYIATVFDKDDTPQRVLERVDMGPCGGSIASIADAEPDENCQWEVPPLDKSFFYRFKRGDKARTFAIGQEDETFTVEGVLLRERQVTLRTDSVVVEALLGVNDALDEYSEDLQVQTIREKKLLNSREALAQRIVREGDATKAELYQMLFVPPEED